MDSKLASLTDPSITTESQWEALGSIWQQWECFRTLPFSTFLSEHCFFAIGLHGVLMVRARPWYGGELWLGIEPDGYVHS